MGRFGAWFKKSDDKEKPPSPSSNPYAQQQTSPPAQHDQYNGNQYSPQPSRGPPFGLPAGPRPGGLPGRVGTGSSGYSAAQSSATEYAATESSATQYSPDLSQPPPYSAGTPSASAQSSPSLGSGYPREKFGAVDGVGRNRFDAPSAPSYNQSTSLSSQRPGGYGNLDTDGGLFANYTPPSKQTASSGVPGPDGVADAGQAYDDRPPMTEEEEDEKSAVDRLNQMMDAGIMSIEDSQRRLLEQGETLAHAHNQAVKHSEQTTLSKHNIAELKSEQHMIKFGRSKEKEKLRAEREFQERLAVQEKEHAQRTEREAKRRAEGPMLLRNPRQQTLGASQNKVKSQYVFEEEDEEVEKEIEDGLDSLLQKTQRVNYTAKAMNEELDYQNRLINTMSERTDQNQDDLIKLRNRLRQFE
ncbi:uncharacterized protein B0T15DRAFT_518697 [Chaetomium strumarium]|uniref:t-SNARE coiled-coil homology domain-containing protein n=1 Tax=Chaetomium strumarium TaxID=1170767 RepID=A0AAJ0H289_9PEZI|nr:hypothetical protein B0T15DRAFT_518697 [Chaetomium strumarium]